MVNLIRAAVERGATYSKQVVLQFIDRKGRPALIDILAKALESSVNVPSLLTVDEIRPLDLDPATGLASKFTARFRFADQDGVVTGRFKADRDVTPQGESDLVIEYEFTIGPPAAQGATLELGEPDADEAVDQGAQGSIDNAGGENTGGEANAGTETGAGAQTTDEK